MNPSSEQLGQELLQDLNNDPSLIAPIIEKLKSNTGEGLTIDPREQSTGFQTWLPISNALMRSNLLQSATQVLMAWYDSLNELQVTNNTRYHKGGVVHNTGVCYFMRGDQARCVWFHACAFAEDIINLGDSTTIPETDARRNLRVHFNWKLDDFKDLAATARAVRNDSGDFCWFPETTLVRLARDEKLRIPQSKTGSGVAINRFFLKN